MLAGTMRRAAIVASVLAFGFAGADLTPFKPTTSELADLYRRADTLGQGSANQILNWNLEFTWIDNDTFYYRRDVSAGIWRFTTFSVSSKQKTDLFDHKKLADQLATLSGSEIRPDRLGIEITRVTGESVIFNFQGKRYAWNRKAETLAAAARPEPVPLQNQGVVSPDRKLAARLQEGHLEIRANKPDGEWKPVPGAENLQTVKWSPDSQFLAAQSQIPGDRRQVAVFDSSKPGTVAQLRMRLYDQPGDKLDTSETYFYGVASGKLVKAAHEPVICGGHPWAAPPELSWWRPPGAKSPSALIEYDIRGFQEQKLVEINPESGAITPWVDEVSPTFIHLSGFFWQRLPGDAGVVWRSERDGWGHLYRYDSPGKPFQITQGQFVVRSIERLTSTEVYFSANGREPGDPYFIRYYRVGLDGRNLVALTPGAGTHKATFSPDFKHLVDVRSTVQNAPVAEVRDSEGKLVAELEASDAGPLRGAGIRGPVPFVAKGRDGATDIYGIIHFPTHFDPGKSYPVIEDIYAGPHDSFVPKSFRPVFYQQRLAELGFIVVQIDGMGTANRGKAFHDVCWKNIADAGLPDRILWIKAAASQYPQMDVSRVGIFGTSAGGQSSTGALLFHPEFYKVAVSSCGCHDNRIDKFWWNEQWMGYPVGPHYEQQSNITNAAKLQGDLLLMVGESDTNVPPESTFKLVDALQKAGKDFEFVYLPGSDHTAGGQYGEHKRRDFFVRHLLGVEPPRWN